MAGFLLPETYLPPSTLPWESTLAHILLALGVSVALLLTIHLTRLSHTRWTSHRRVPLYLVLAWLDLVAGITHSTLGWCVGHGRCPAQPSLWFFLAVILLWAVERHCLAQILANRVAVLLTSAVVGRRLKWGVFLGTAVLTVSVVVVWTPGTMEISPAWERANEVWDRGEKVCFMVGDVGLNAVFVWVVRQELVRRHGLGRYKDLWRVNVAMVAATVVLDAAVVASTWFPDYWIYIQFRPLVHLVKLYFELCNAELIGKVAAESVRERCGSLEEVGVTVEAEEGKDVEEGRVLEGRAPGLARLDAVYSPRGSLDEEERGGEEEMKEVRISEKQHQLTCVRHPG